MRGHRRGHAGGLAALLAAGAVVWPSVSMAVAVQTPVTLVETMDWVAADAYFPESQFPGAPPQPAHAPWPVWPVLRLDVTNQAASQGVYQLLIGARPGIYDWSQGNEPAMQFGSPWFPLNQPQGFRPQSTNGDGTLDWRTELLPVTATPAGPPVDLSDGVSGLAVPLVLPATFAGYSHVYRFETLAPFTACGGGCALDSVPIGLGDTFSYYVTGGMASPLVYFDTSDYLADGRLRGTYDGGTLPVPEPTSLALMVIGLAGLFGRARSRP